MASRPQQRKQTFCFWKKQKIKFKWLFSFEAAFKRKWAKSYSRNYRNCFVIYSFSLCIHFLHINGEIMKVYLTYWSQRKTQTCSRRIIVPSSELCSVLNFPSLCRSIQPYSRPTQPSPAQSEPLLFVYGSANRPWIREHMQHLSWVQNAAFEWTEEWAASLPGDMGTLEGRARQPPPWLVIQTNSLGR